MWNGAVIGAQQGLSGRDNWGCERDCVDCWLMYSEWHEPCAPRRVNDTVAEREIPFFSSLACCQVPMRHQGLNVLRKVLWDRKSDPAGRVPPNWTKDRNRGYVMTTKKWPQVCPRPKYFPPYTTVSSLYNFKFINGDKEVSVKRVKNMLSLACYRWHVSSRCNVGSVIAMGEWGLHARLLKNW